jgi:tight adherence protein B
MNAIHEATMSTPLVTPIPRRAEFRGILRDEERFATGRGDVGDRLNGWFDRLMVQSGSGLAPSLAAVLCLASAIAFGGAMWVLQENPLSAGLAALVGFVLPVGVLSILRSRRRSKILKQMPEMVEELARAARTGRSLEACLEIVAEDTPAPLGLELQESVRRVQMGLPVSAALRDLTKRTGVEYLSVFTMALALHQESGGDLVRVLERLTQTVRDRIAFLGRLKVATVASRATAILMLVLPPAILTFFVIRDPGYLNALFASDWGRRTLFIAVGLQVVGTLWVLRILKTSERA